MMFLNIAMQLRDSFYKLVALGLGTCYIFQTFLTIGGVTKFIPSTGVTLPLVSYGGTSVLSTIIMFAIIQGLYVLREDEEEDIERKKLQRRRTSRSGSAAGEPARRERVSRPKEEGRRKKPQQTNIFKYPELSDSEKASSLIGTFEEKKQLADLVADTMADDKNTGIQVYIGNETPVQTMKDCSVVTATYELGDGMRGTIGIIGPKRMDYDRVVGTLKTLTTQLDDIFGKKKEDN